MRNLLLLAYEAAAVLLPGLVLGAALGLLLYRALAWAGQRCGRKRGEVCEPTPALYIVALFAGRFLLFHELWAAGLLYGFAG